MTKRNERVLEFGDEIHIGENIIIGFTKIETEKGVQLKTYIQAPKELEIKINQQTTEH